VGDALANLLRKSGFAVSKEYYVNDAGAQVTVFEAGRTPGGRARRIVQPGFGEALDNGQHILMGAFKETLALMRRLGRNPDTLLMRRPLRLASLDGTFRLSALHLPAPWQGVAAMLTARGLGWRDKLAALRFVRDLQARGLNPPPVWTVGELLAYRRQPPELVRKVWIPVCLAALNTPPEQASAALFARVLKYSLAGGPRASDMLMPCVDLSALWPDAAALRLTVHYHSTVRQLHVDSQYVDVNGERFEAAVLATPPAVVMRLLGKAMQEQGAMKLIETLQGFDPQPIATLYLRLARPWPLPEPMLMLREDKPRGHAGQWLFDRSRLTGQDRQAQLAIVAGAAPGLAELPRERVIDALAAQVREQAAQGGLPPMPEVEQAELFIESGYRCRDYARGAAKAAVRSVRADGDHIELRCA
jgi:uncharacterized protein with NAD-binding domain and iron-sulfur cluster